MLDAYIIDHLRREQGRKREQRRERARIQPLPDAPKPEPPPDQGPFRGVVIIGPEGNTDTGVSPARGIRVHRTPPAIREVSDVRC